MIERIWQFIGICYLVFFIFAMTVLLTSCEMMQHEQKAAMDINHDCVMEKDGVRIECRLEGKRKDSSQGDATSFDPPVGGN